GTTFIGHYQPLAWLTWSAMNRLFGPSPAAFHAISLAVHLLNAILICLIAWRMTSLAGFAARVRVAEGSDTLRRSLAAFVAAAAFAAHPVRVEAVAWASAFPYVLSTAALLL